MSSMLEQAAICALADLLGYFQNDRMDKNDPAQNTIIELYEALANGSDETKRRVAAYKPDVDDVREIVTESEASCEE